MNTFRFWRAMAGCVGVVLGGVACGGGGSAIDAQTAPIEAWRSYCVATFQRGFECAGAEIGFARVPPVTVRDTSTHLVPIRTILGPA